MMVDEETLQIYVEEAEEHLADIEKELLTIEQMGAAIDEEIVNKVFRAAHSIKGGAGFMGLTNIKDLSHKLENILGLVRDRKLVPNPEVINILLLGFDKLHELIRQISTSNEIDINEQLVALSGLTTTSLPPDDKKTVTQMISIKLSDNSEIFSVSKFDLDQARKGGKYLFLMQYDLIRDVHNKGYTPFDIIKKIQQSGVIIDSKVDFERVGGIDDNEFETRIPFFILHASIIEPEMIGEILELDSKFIQLIPDELLIVESKPKQEPKPILKPLPITGEQISPPKQTGEQISPPKQTGEQISPPIQEVKQAIPKPLPTQKPASDIVPKAETPKKQEIKKPETLKETKAKTQEPKETSLRVNIALLDSLMNLAGELVLSRNQLLQAVYSNNKHLLEVAKQRIDIVTSELQEAIMLTRMQPIGKIFNKFPRVIHDLAQELGKEIQLTIDGKDVELDKNIIEGLNDPLTHMLRNAADHGVEMPEERKKAGKKEVGEIFLRAFHEAGHINIEIVDDGKGINIEKLLEKAIAKELVTEEQARSMSEKDKINLIFLPGLSTAQKVTDISGRGVGMDVVKSNLDRLGGIIDIHSVFGEGTTIRIKLPLTLAIIPSLLVSAGSERYAIPQVNLVELLRIPAKQVSKRIEIVGNAKVVRLRETLLPILNLSDVIGVSSNKGANRAVNIAVVYAGSFKYGLVVEALHDSEEIVVKPLGRHLKKCKEYAGATILGDGRVALILDVGNLARRAALTSLEETKEQQEKKRAVGTSVGDLESFLVFRSSYDEQFAVPLGLVARLEKIHAKDIEKVGNRKVFQYRGGTIPLFAMHEVANVKPIAERDSYIAIVFTISGKEFGLFATAPVDSVAVVVNVDDRIFKQPGILGSMIIGKHTTLMVDVYGFIKTIQPQWLDQAQVDTSKATILLAEDTAFFRKQMQNFMEDEGYTVLVAEDGQIAFEMLQEHYEEISVIVTDIEMPNMDGLTFTREIKKDPKFSHLPIIAVTSLSEDRHKIEGKKAGIDDYQVKLDRERLLKSIEHYLKLNEKGGK